MKNEMSVVSYVELSVPTEERHLKVARSAAESLTSDKSSVTIEVPNENPKLIVTKFPKAAQNLHAILRDCCDGSDIEPLYRRCN